MKEGGRRWGGWAIPALADDEIDDGEGCWEEGGFGEVSIVGETRVSSGVYFLFLNSDLVRSDQSNIKWVLKASRHFDVAHTWGWPW